MRVFLHSSVGVAIALFAGISIAFAQQPVPAAPPELDVSISVGPTHPREVELLGRPSPGSVYCSISVQEPGAHRYYFPPLSIALAPDGTERVTKEAAGLTFAFTATAKSHNRTVQAELVVSQGSHILGRYRSHAEFPTLGSAQ
jgi:hypothetical protein